LAVIVMLGKAHVFSFPVGATIVSSPIFPVTLIFGKSPFEVATEMLATPTPALISPRNSVLRFSVPVLSRYSHVTSSTSPPPNHCAFAMSPFSSGSSARVFATGVFVDPIKIRLAVAMLKWSVSAPKSLMIHLPFLLLVNNHCADNAAPAKTPPR
jgi:hypothetical protein